MSEVRPQEPVRNLGWLLTGFVRVCDDLGAAAAGRLLAELLPEGQGDGGDGRQLFPPGGSVCLCQRLGRPAQTPGQRSSEASGSTRTTYLLVPSWAAEMLQLICSAVL